MSQDLNLVKPIVRLNGEEILFESLTLEQSMNSCHHFDVVREFMSQNELWEESPQKLVSYVGARMMIRFEHQESGTPYEFSGYVTDVRIDAWESEPDFESYNHRSNRVHFIGEGDVVRLDGSLGMDSFVDNTLKSIVSESVSPSGIQLECNPRFDGVIPYVMRYKESIFGFLNRLSSTYNELFFYDGKKLSFGKPGNCGEESLVFEQDVFSLRTHASAVPHKVAAYDYFAESDLSACINASRTSAGGLLGSVMTEADRLFDDKELVASGSPLTDNGYLMSLVGNKQQSLEGSLLNVEGETRTCRIKLGTVVEINFPSKVKASSLGKFRIISIVHRVNKNGNYSNHFVATPEGHEYVTQKFLESVKAYPEVAWVSSNSDPKGIGRVQVQFDWQKRVGKNSNWVRVQSPDAGGSGMKNRGLVFVPEPGDQVMVGFEFGDPNRPYVMGSLFTGKNGAGGDSGNNYHTIVTKSGRQIILNDGGDGGIIIADANGSCIELSVAGSSITITAPEEILLQSKNIRMEADENITVIAGKDYDRTVKAKNTISVQGDSSCSVKGKYQETVEKDFSTNIKGKLSTKIEKDCSQKITGKLDVTVDKDCKTDIKGKLTCEVAKDGKINSKSKLYVTGGGNVYVGK